MWEAIQSYLSGALVCPGIDNDTDCFGVLSEPTDLFTEFYFDDGTYLTRSDKGKINLVGLGFQTGHLTLEDQVDGWKKVTKRVTWNDWTGSVIDDYIRSSETGFTRI